MNGPSFNSSLNNSSRPSPREVLNQTQQSQPSLMREVIGLCHHERKWWLSWALAGPLLIAALVALGSTAISPLVYHSF